MRAIRAAGARVDRRIVSPQRRATPVYTEAAAADAGFASNRTQVRRLPLVLASGRRRASLIVIRGDDVGREYPLTTDEVVIGRDPRLGIALADEMASRRHARICRVGSADENRHVITDLDSTNGVIVGNQRRREVELRDGDRIVLGETILLYRVLDEIDIDYQREIQKLIRYHHLTGFLTLKEFFRVVERALRAGDDRFAILMVDVDNLKEINDLYGHLAGSAVIRRIGELFRSHLTGEESVGIYGGDEFVCHLPTVDEAHAVEVAERLRRAVASDELLHDGTRIPFSVCIGLALRPDHGHSIQELIRAADMALYRAKALGRNRTVPYRASAGA